MRIEKSCPIPKTHSRLRQAHDLWHEVALAYPDADHFVTKLNACISAARSVTWVLQKEAHKLDGFDSWYADQQDGMRADSRLRWLVEARNAIEKQGDLDTSSVARVSLILTDGEYQMADVEMSPLVGPREAAHAIKLDQIPERIRRQGVMAVERRWTVPELPDDELLDALAHCYGCLAAIVKEAHQLCGVKMQTFGGEVHGGRHDREVHPSGRLHCMLPTKEIRTAYWHLGAESLIEQEAQPLIAPSEKDRTDFANEARRRYGDLRRHQLMPGMPMRERVKAMHQIARVMLESDGYHQTLAWTFRDATPVGQVVLTPADQQDKIVKMRHLASEVQRDGADAVIFTTEVWWAPEVAPNDVRFDQRAVEREDREELLATHLLERSGDPIMWASTFSHADDDAIWLGEPHKGSMEITPLFEPIFEVWESWDQASGSADPSSTTEGDLE